MRSFSGHQRHGLSRFTDAQKLLRPLCSGVKGASVSARILNYTPPRALQAALGHSPDHTVLTPQRGSEPK